MSIDYCPEALFFHISVKEDLHSNQSEENYVNLHNANQVVVAGFANFKFLIDKGYEVGQ